MDYVRFPHLNITSYDDYLEYMVRDTNWGDQSTLQAVANLYQISITVYSTGGDQPLEIDPRSGRTEMKLVIAHISERHYDSTKPLS